MTSCFCSVTSLCPYRYWASLNSNLSAFIVFFYKHGGKFVSTLILFIASSRFAGTAVLRMASSR